VDLEVKQRHLDEDRQRQLDLEEHKQRDLEEHDPDQRRSGGTETDSLAKVLNAHG
jgi:hypothetical protein